MQRTRAWSYKVGNGSGYADAGNVISGVFALRLGAGGEVEEARLGWAGLRPSPFLATATAAALVNR